MAYPTKYTRQFGFNDWQATHPSDPLPGHRVDSDLNAVQVSIDTVVEFLKLHSRSDGALANGSVTLDSLSSEVVTAINAGDAGGVDAAGIDFTPAGNISATNVQAAIEELDSEKLAVSSYTAADVLAKLLTVDGVGSGLDADLLDGNQASAFATVAHVHSANEIVNTAAGNIAATTVQAAINELDSEKLAASSYTAADVLAKLLTVDGAGSGLDADFLDGQSSAAFATASHTHAAADVTSGTFADARISASSVTQHAAAIEAALTLTASQIANVAAGNIAATDVQAALNELDTEKLAGVVEHPGYLTSRYYPTWEGAVTNAAVAAADILLLYPFRVAHTVTVKTLFCRVITGGAGSAVKMGLWANSAVSNRPLGAPLTADNTGQATTGSGTNPEADVADVTLTPGWYWAGSKFTGTLPTMWACQGNNPFTMAVMGSANVSALIQTGLSIASPYGDDMPTLSEGASFSMSTVAMPLLGFST